MKICIVRADYYPEISKTLYEGACSELINNKLHINKEQIRLIPAPGIFEVPVIISRYINDYDGFIAISMILLQFYYDFDDCVTFLLRFR